MNINKIFFFKYKYIKKFKNTKYIKYIKFKINTFKII